ncbi:MAG: DUF4280 domain-containing protein [Polyangiaceae bacterium]|nr:DUF4280 domain-containing protein [Polyangiaceae bacterium]
MRRLVVHEAKIRCSQGTIPSLLVIPPDSPVSSDNKPVGTVDDHKPMKNIITFGMCRSLQNPTVQSATTAAAGVLTPQACVPATNKQWSPGAPFAVVDEVRVLSSDSTCSCDWGGTIDILDPVTEVEIAEG